MRTQHFVKCNATRYPDALMQEAQGLMLLRDELTDHSITELRIPEIYAATEKSLILERIICCSPTRQMMEQVGMGLAKLHKYSRSSHYGLAGDNCIGLNRQINNPASEWGHFFVTHRLEFQIDLIEDQKVKNRFVQRIKDAKINLIDFLNSHCEQASLCHGDLWSGNVLFSLKGCYLIDPATYYGDREVDIAMTEMFSGFGPQFYQSYSTVYPLTREYSRKAKIYNLYHYLNHYNLFGNSYLSDCEDILQQIKMWFK